MKPWTLFLCSILAFATGAVQLSLSIASNRPPDTTSPWFFLGMFASFTGSSLVLHERRLRALETEVARLQGSRAGAATESGSTQPFVSRGP
jgi:hypothetical protein